MSFPANPFLQRNQLGRAWGSSVGTSPSSDICELCFFEQVITSRSRAASYTKWRLKCRLFHNCLEKIKVEIQVTKEDVRQCKTVFNVDCISNLWITCFYYWKCLILSLCHLPSLRKSYLGLHPVFPANLVHITPLTEKSGWRITVRRIVWESLDLWGQIQTPLKCSVGTAKPYCGFGVDVLI